MEEQLRKSAVERYLKGEKPKAIYTSLKRTKAWFFKWLKRYRTGHPEWYKSQSRAPINPPGRISDIEKQRIVETRKRLENERFAQTGAAAIKWELAKSGFKFPSDRTINRVLKQEGLIKKNSICSQRC